MIFDPFKLRVTQPTPRDKKPKTIDELHNYMLHRTFHDSRQLREFSIKGHKVMAYSRKDAITRLKHRKKI